MAIPKSTAYKLMTWPERKIVMAGSKRDMMRARRIAYQKGQDLRLVLTSKQIGEVFG